MPCLKTPYAAGARSQPVFRTIALLILVRPARKALKYRRPTRYVVEALPGPGEKRVRALRHDAAGGRRGQPVPGMHEVRRLLRRARKTARLTTLPSLACQLSSRCLLGSPFRSPV